MNAADVLKVLGIGGLAVFAALKVWDATMLLRELKVALIGIDGKNGMRAELQSCRSDVAGVRGEVGEVRSRLDDHLVYHERLATAPASKPKRGRR